VLRVRNYLYRDRETRSIGTSNSVSPVSFLLSMHHCGALLSMIIDDQNPDFNPNVPTLKQVRERLGMTQEQFADALGLSRNTINRYERGIHQRIALSVGQIKRLVELMKQAGLSIEDLPDDID
jgi:DNA-binding XRE family transcriptional regulator